MSKEMLSSIVLFCAASASLADGPGKEGVDLRSQRVETIKTCEHGTDEPCPHGRVWYVDAQASNALVKAGELGR